MNIPALLLLLQLAAANATTNDDTQLVTLRLSGIEAASGEVVLHARAATGAKSLDFELETPDSSIRLPAGQWFLSAARAGYWSESSLVVVGSTPVDATVALHRATPLQAIVTIPSSGTAQTVDVHFNPSDSTSTLPTASTTCPVVNARMNCDVPSGVYDLAFRVQGHVSIYRWHVDLRGTSPIDLGTLAFRAGSTLSGRVDVANTGEPIPSLDRVEVRVRNAVADGRTDMLRQRETITRAIARPNQRGFFSFAVQPGTYFLSAGAEGLASEEREVTVTEGRELALKEPLILARPLMLTVRVRVPPEGANRAWKLALTRVGALTDEPPEQIVDVPPDGICRFARQFPGLYDVELRLADSVWSMQRVTLESDATLEMVARARRVRGSIQIADVPLEARAVFERSEGAAWIRVPVQSRSDGTFLAFLPEMPGDRWESVAIQSTQPAVKHVLHAVVLDRDEDGVATLNLRLPAASISGIVVDERDRRVMDGVITITGPEITQQTEMADGTFAFHGLPSGRYTLTAFSHARETKDPVQVEIEDDDADHPVLLKIAPASELRGSVVSAWGPAIGTSIFIAPAHYAHPVIAPVPVDTAGQFRFQLPPDTREVLIALNAPGFAFRMMRRSFPETKLDLAVDQSGGVLTIDGGVGLSAQPFRPCVIHNGAVLTGFAMSYLAHGRPLANLEERVHFEVPAAEEGMYTLCLLSREEERRVLSGAHPPAERCVSGMLARHGALTLRMPAARHSN